MKLTYAIIIYILAIIPQSIILLSHRIADVLGIKPLKYAVIKIDKSFTRAMDLLPIPEEYR